MTLASRLTDRYFRRLVATPEGRAHVLNQCADAESNGECRIFEQALSLVDDDELRRLIRRHQDDEVRHAAMFREQAERVGVDVGPVPAHLKLIDRIDRALGGMLARPIADRRGVMEAYLLLQVLEERAVSQFPIFERGFREIDPAVSAVFAAVLRDEHRHLRYCEAIARRYAPDEAAHRETLARFRRVEARAFAANSRANMRHALDRGYVAMGPIEKRLWSALAALLPVLAPEQPTAFARHGSPPRPALAA